MDALEMAHRLRTIAGEQDEIGYAMTRMSHQSSAWRERAEELADDAAHARILAAQIEREAMP